MKIGIVPGSFKPYTVGHDKLVRLAASDCDEVHVYASLADRENVSGAAMQEVWRSCIEPSLPGNVTVTYGGSPIGNAYKEMGEASERFSNDAFYVYSATEDMGRFSNEALQKYAPNVDVVRVGLDRTETDGISGTRMRSWLANGNKDEFVSNLPKTIDGDLAWNILFSSQKRSTR
jgi:citrate lyase synthetase